MISKLKPNNEHNHLNTRVIPGEIDICPEMRRGVHFTIFGAVLLTASRVFLGFGSGTNQN